MSAEKNNPRVIPNLEKMKIILDNAEIILAKNLLEIIPRENGFLLRVREDAIRDLSPEVTIIDFRNFQIFLHYLSTSQFTEQQEFLESFEESKRNDVQACLDLFLQHPNNALFLYRHIRSGNFISDQFIGLKNKTETTLFGQQIMMNSCCLSLPFYDSGERRQKVLRIEMDKYELNTLISQFSSLL